MVKSKERIKKNAEVFTPPQLVNDMLNKLPEECWQEGKTFLDPACGNGNFLVEVLKRKLELNHTNPLQTIYGVELMEDNTKECRERLLNLAGDNKKNRKIVERNIVCHNALTYDYEFK